MGAAMLSSAGALVVLLTLAAAWAFLRRAVIYPVTMLNQASMTLAEGDLSARAPACGQDELGNLCRSFNTMADRLQAVWTKCAKRMPFYNP